MKELKHNQTPIITTHYPVRQNNSRKRWVIAQARPEKQQVDINNCIEDAYHRIINAVKKLHMKLGDIYFERDYKTDKSEGLLGMHSFMSKEFYFTLYCEMTNIYVVHYSFHCCTYEAELRKMLHQFPLDKQAAERDLKPDFKTFYSNVLALQKPRFIYTL